MAYSPKGVMDIYEILSRWHAGYSISGIAEALGIDRKTVRRYVRAAEAGGLSREGPLPERSALLERLLPLVADKEREAPARSQFEPFRDEIVELVTRSTDPLKPKTAFEVICHRHDVEASYTSFKRYCPTKRSRASSGSTRFDLWPWEEASQPKRRLCHRSPSRRTSRCRHRAQNSPGR